MTAQQIEEIIILQRSAFHQESVQERREHLGRLESAVKRYERELAEALLQDLGKDETESYMCETGLALSEIRFLRKHLAKWMRPKRVRTNPANFPAKSYLVHDPWGEVLVMSPWNYPVMLSLEPLAGALAGGNSVIIKPSAYAPHVSRLLKRMLDETFPQTKVATIEGGREENQALLGQRFDYIFFTGSPAVGRQVMEQASRHLTPVSLELGGKSPVIVTESANLKLAAKRIVFGKFLNMGQTCVAPDYLLVDRKVEKQLVSLLQDEILRQYGSGFSGHIVNAKHFERITGLIDQDKVCFGGRTEALTLKIEPTLMRGVTLEDRIMQEEIFGPVLPIITYRNPDEAVSTIGKLPTPLALYLFTGHKRDEGRFLSLPFGGGCLNDTVMHLTTPYLPFGGAGESGMGSYHGWQSFATFTHQKSLLEQSARIDLPIRYRPYTKATRRLLKLIFERL